MTADKSVIFGSHSEEQNKHSSGAFNCTDLFRYFKSLKVNFVIFTHIFLSKRSLHDETMQQNKQGGD